MVDKWIVPVDSSVWLKMNFDHLYIIYFAKRRLNLTSRYLSYLKVLAQNLKNIEIFIRKYKNGDLQKNLKSRVLDASLSYFF